MENKRIMCAIQAISSKHNSQKEDTGMKEIRMRMTIARAEEMGFQISQHLWDFVIAPVKIHMEKLSPAARWLAENITSTYVADELLDRIPVLAVAGFSMKTRDQGKGMAVERIARLERMYGDAYTSPMEMPMTFPIYGHALKSPEDVLERAVQNLREQGAVKLRLYKSYGDAACAL